MTPRLVVTVRRSRAFGALAAATRPIRRTFDLSYVYTFDLTGQVPNMRAIVPVDMVRASPAEVEEAAALADPAFVPVFLARLDDGMACFVAKVEGRVVAYNWTRYRSGLDEGDVIELGEGEIYTTDAFTAEPFRGRQIHGETLAHMLVRAKENGYVRAFTMRSALKRGSRKALRRLGWRLSGRVLRLPGRGGRLRVVTVTGSRRPLA